MLTIEEVLELLKSTQFRRYESDDHGRIARANRPFRTIMDNTGQAVHAILMSKQEQPYSFHTYRIESADFYIPSVTKTLYCIFHKIGEEVICIKTPKVNFLYEVPVSAGTMLKKCLGEDLLRNVLSFLSPCASKSMNYLTNNSQYHILQSNSHAIKRQDLIKIRDISCTPINKLLKLSKKSLHMILPYIHSNREMIIKYKAGIQMSNCSMPVFNKLFKEQTIKRFEPEILSLLHKEWKSPATPDGHQARRNAIIHDNLNKGHYCDHNIDIPSDDNKDYFFNRHWEALNDNYFCTLKPIPTSEIRRRYSWSRALYHKMFLYYRVIKYGDIKIPVKDNKKIRAEALEWRKAFENEKNLEGLTMIDRRAENRAIEKVNGTEKMKIALEVSKKRDHEWRETAETYVDHAEAIHMLTDFYGNEKLPEIESEVLERARDVLMDADEDIREMFRKEGLYERRAIRRREREKGMAKKIMDMMRNVPLESFSREKIKVLKVTSTVTECVVESGKKVMKKTICIKDGKEFKLGLIWRKKEIKWYNSCIEKKLVELEKFKKDEKESERMKIIRDFSIDPEQLGKMKDFTITHFDKDPDAIKFNPGAQSRSIIRLVEPDFKIDQSRLKRLRNFKVEHYDGTPKKFNPFLKRHKRNKQSRFVKIKGEVYFCRIDRERATRIKRKRKDRIRKWKLRAWRYRRIAYDVYYKESVYHCPRRIDKIIYSVFHDNDYMSQEEALDILYNTQVLSGNEDMPRNAESG